MDIQVSYLFMERKPPLLVRHRVPLVRCVPRDILRHNSELCFTKEAAVFTHCSFILVRIMQTSFLHRFLVVPNGLLFSGFPSGILIPISSDCPFPGSRQDPVS